MTDHDPIARTRFLNDLLRQHGIGGRLAMTAGVAALAPEALAQLLAAVRTFDEFTHENDPHGEHDCAVVTVAEAHFIWKIDYYNPTLTGASPDPCDPRVCVRVLTIMRADEY